MNQNLSTLKETNFFLGKGGVGKSTLASLTALYLAQQKFKVILVSLDPAHNLGDIFQLKLTEAPKNIVDMLYLSEIDQSHWITEYLSRIEDQVRQAYNYLTSFNLTDYFQVIRHSPGLEEYGLLSAYQHMVEAYQNFDFIFFDMPPTALSLKFFSLPSISLIWLNYLTKLRTEILDKKKMVSRIRKKDQGDLDDKIFINLQKQTANYQSIQQRFQNSLATKINLVMTPEYLPEAETQRIVGNLTDLKIAPQRLLINKSDPGDLQKYSWLKPNFKVLTFKTSDKPLIGLNQLETFISENTHVFQQLFG